MSKQSSLIVLACLALIVLGVPVLQSLGVLPNPTGRLHVGFWPSDGYVWIADEK